MLQPWTAVGCRRLFCGGGGGGGSGRFVAVGDRVTMSKRVDKTDVDAFGRLTGDTNAVHAGHRPLVHGAYLAALVSGLIGTRLPGHGTVLAAKSLRFPRPCYAGDRVDVEVEVRAVRKLIRCAFRCRVGGAVVMHGTADVVNRDVAERPPPVPPAEG